ncbi:MAPEG family protein [Pseudoalteromonas maricaloris]|uniref:MAPEG family protein n=1 Tax=Pseudoalteromonas maricaloris TaxID=184924 RepID=UPI003C256AA5
MPTSIYLLLAALFLQTLLTLVIMVIMGKRRFKAAREKQIQFDQFKTMALDNAPEEVILASRNFTNQFEIPVLFFVVSLAALAMKLVTLWFSIFALLFVISRIAHAYVHIGSNHIRTRFRLYLAGCVFIVLQWITLLLTLI